MRVFIMDVAAYSLFASFGFIHFQQILQTCHVVTIPDEAQALVKKLQDYINVIYGRIRSQS